MALPIALTSLAMTGATACHRFKNHIRQPVAVARRVNDRRHDDGVSIRILIRKFRMRLRAAERDLLFKPGSGNETFKAVSLRAFADDAQPKGKESRAAAAMRTSKPFFSTSLPTARSRSGARAAAGAVGIGAGPRREASSGRLLRSG